MRPVQIPASAAGGGIGCGLREFAAEEQAGEAQPDDGLPVPPRPTRIIPLHKTVHLMLRHHAGRVLR